MFYIYAQMYAYKALENCTRVQWGAVVRVVWVQSNLRGTTSVEGHFQLVATQQKYNCTMNGFLQSVASIRNSTGSLPYIQSLFSRCHNFVNNTILFVRFYHDMYCH
jgi:hypothetical protein